MLTWRGKLGMEEHIREIEEKINELKSWQSALEREAIHEKWVRRVGYFAAGWGFGKIITKKSTFLSNLMMGAGFFMGHGAGVRIDSLSQNYALATEMIEDREKELEDLKRLDEEQKEKAKTLNLEPTDKK